MSKKVFALTIVALLCVFSLPTLAQGIFDQTADWEGRGEFKAPGDASFSGGTYTMEGNGDDIWENTDEGFFAYTELEGSHALEGKVLWVDTNNHDWAKIGVMVRDVGDLPTSKHYWTMLRGAEFGDLSGPQWRPTEGGASYWSEQLTEDGESVSDPGDGLYLRVTRIAEFDLCFSEWSFDGSEWNVAHAVIVEMDDPVAYGLAITDHQDDETVAVAEVSDVELGDPKATIGMRQFEENPDVVFTGGEPNNITLLVGGAAGSITVTETPPSGWDISDISHGGAFADGVITWELSDFDGAEELTYVATPPADASENGAFEGDVDGLETFGDDNIPAPKPIGIFDNHLDIGDVAAAGDASVDGDTYYVIGSGADIWGGADEFHFAYKKMTGGFTIRVEEVFEWGGDLEGNSPSGNDWQKSGLMVRDNLTAGSPHYNQIIRSSDLEMRTQWRDSQGSASAGGGGSETSTEFQAGYMEIVRVQDTFFAYTIDTTTGERTQIHSYTNPNIQDPVYVGLAVTSHEDGNFTTGEFINVEFGPAPVVARRSLSAGGFAPGDTISVTLEVINDNPDAEDVSISETFPEGWTASNISDGGSASAGTISWSLSAEPGITTLTYDITAPEEADAEAQFSGEIGETGIAGDSSLTLMLPMPEEDPLFDYHADIFDTFENLGEYGGAEYDADEDVYTIWSSGADVWGNADQFHFVWTELSGDFVLTANGEWDFSDRSTSDDDWIKMLLMARENLTPGSPNFATRVRRDGQYSWQYRADQDAGSSSTPGEDRIVFADWGYFEDEWPPMRLERVGDTFHTYFYDEFDEDWIEIGEAQEIPLEDPLLVGIAVTAHQAASIQYGWFSNVELEGGTAVSEWMLMD